MMQEGNSLSQDRRDFLKAVCAGAVAAALPAVSLGAAAAVENIAPTAAALQVPTVTIAGRTIPRMIVGSNPIGGWSHQVRNMTLAMLDYFTVENIAKFLRSCEKQGLTLFLPPFQDKTLTALKTLWAEGSQIRTYFLGELDKDGKLSKNVLDYRPIWHVHHGNVTDSLFRAGKHELVHTFVKKVHDELGLPAGVSCHNPDCVKYMEDKGWEVDFYQTCLFYLTRPKQDIRAKLGAAPLGEPFLDTDRRDMTKVIKAASKPCIAFKILGAGWLCNSDSEVEDAFQFALSNIKKTDPILVGMWPKYKDEVTQNVQLLKQYGA
jgi:hypothetical protein